MRELWPTLNSDIKTVYDRFPLPRRKESAPTAAPPPFPLLSHDIMARKTLLLPCNTPHEIATTGRNSLNINKSVLVTAFCN